MPHPLYDRHLRTLEALESALAHIPEGRWTLPPVGGGWCAAEIYDHVGRIAMLYSFPKLEACLEGRGRKGRRTFAGWLLLRAPWLAGAIRLRQRFPPEMVPRAITKAQASAMLQALRSRAADVAPRLFGADPGMRVEHVRLGWLNAEQWFAFAEIHSRHHLKGQLRRLMAAQPALER